MIDAITALLRRVSTGWLIAAIMASTATLVVLGYTAVSQWQRGARLLAQRRADSGVELLVTALTHDMRGAQTIVLPQLGLEQQMTESPLDVHSVGSAFARYPYPEAFFAARQPGRPNGVHERDKLRQNRRLCDGRLRRPRAVSECVSWRGNTTEGWPT